MMWTEGISGHLVIQNLEDSCMALLIWTVRPDGFRKAAETCKNKDGVKI